MENEQINREKCLAKVLELQTNYQWKLMDADTLSTASMTKLETNSSPELQPTIIATYVGEALYPCFLGQQGLEKREQAARELASFLHRTLYRRWPSLAEHSSDLTQAAIKSTLQKIGSCHKGDAFLTFAASKLRTAVQKKIRQLDQDQKIDPIDMLEGQGREPSVSDNLEDGLSMEMIQKQIRHYQKTNPKATTQLEAVYLRYCEGLTVEETAERLSMTSRNVSVLTSRGLKFLRERKDEFIF